MNQEERRRYLIEELLRERPSCRSQEIPADTEGQKVLLRGLMNVRHPAATSKEFLEVQDAYLQEELAGKKITRLSGPALGRSKKGENRNKVQDYRDECERVEVERKFSLGKRKCGIGLVTAKLEETAAHVVALSILLLNLRKIQCTFLQFWDWLVGFLQPCEIMMVIQYP